MLNPPGSPARPRGRGESGVSRLKNGERGTGRLVRSGGWPRPPACVANQDTADTRPLMKTPGRFCSTAGGAHGGIVGSDRLPGGGT